MQLFELKSNILAGNLPNKFIILVCQENFFIADQYIDTICYKTGKTKQYISSIYEQESASSLLFDDAATVLKILKVETFEEYSENYEALSNVIVICNKIAKKLEQSVSDYIIEIPKVVPWQLEAYILQVCPELDSLEAQWLIQATGANIYRIDLELAKLNLFTPIERKSVLAKLRFTPESDLYYLDSFSLCDAILYNNKAIIVDYLKHRSNTNFEFMNLVSILLSKAKNMLLILYGRKSCEDLGLNSNYYNRLKRGQTLPLHRLQEVINITSKLDLQLKSGLLDLPKNLQIDYLISKLCN